MATMAASSSSSSVAGHRQIHSRKASSGANRAPPTPKDDTTIYIAPTPVLGSSARMGDGGVGYSGSVELRSSPRLNTTPRMTSAAFRSPKLGFDAPRGSPKLEPQSPKRRQRAASRGKRKLTGHKVGWRDVISHYGRSPRGWAAAAVILFLLLLIRVALGEERRSQWSMDEPRQRQTYANMVAYMRDQAVAVGQKAIAANPLPAIITGRLPAVLGLSPSYGRRKPTTPALAHTYHPNGLLLVNPAGRHPIHGLIERAEREWRLKVHGQSRTLPAAIATYRQRYHRNPPAGFDKWWTWAKERKVILVDEYDQVHRDFEPFHALEPVDLRHRNKVMQERAHTFTVSIDLRDGKVSVHGEWAEIRRATDTMDLVQTFAKSLPGVGSDIRREGKRAMQWLNITIIVDDQPAVLMSYEHRARMKELSNQGEYFSVSEWVETSDPKLSNYARACPPTSQLRRSERNETVPDFSVASGVRSFIHDHTAAMDLCQHPEHRQLHGFTAGEGVGLGPIVPLFTFAKMQMHTDVLITPLEQYSDTYIGFDPPWNEKTKNKLLWRGSTTGARFEVDHPWRQSQRARLHFLTHGREGNRTILLSELGKAVLHNVTKAELNDYYMDTSFAGGPVQCDDETCKIMEDEIQFAPTQGLDDSYQYKYLMDVDGNGWSGRFHRLMSTKSLVLKSTVFPEWYADRIKPWVHYVPIKVDYSDLYDTMAFFMGSPDGRGAHDALAERIATAGKQWAADSWRREDMGSYMFRICLEYLRLLDREMGTEVDYFEDASP